MTGDSLGNGNNGKTAALEADREAVLAANQRLYESLENNDLEALEDVWLSAADADDKGGVVCVHPGWPVLRGRAQVTRSYLLIMMNTEYIQFFLTDVEAEVQGDVALVTCTENILSGGEAEEEGSWARWSAARWSPPTCSVVPRTAGGSGRTTAHRC